MSGSSSSSQVDPDRGSDHGQGRRRQRALAWALALLVPAAVLVFGAVHAEVRLALFLAAAPLGAAALVASGGRGGGRGGLAPGLVATVGLLLAAGLVAGGGFLPLSSAARATLQPELAGPVLAALAEAGRGDAARPLALDPARGLVEWIAWLASALVLGGTAAAVRNRPRARRLALVLLGTGVGLTALGLLQRWTGADSVYWLSPVPLRSSRPFFGTFVNPNHAGVLLAACMPPTLALLSDRRTTVRLAAAVGSLVLLVGTLVSGSRGAVVLLGLGSAAALGLAGPAWLRRGTGLALLAAGGLVLVLGPVEVADWLTGALDPAQQAAIGAGHQDLWSGRGQLYPEVLRLARAAPALGVGPAGFDDAYRMVRAGVEFSISEHAHQELLQSLIEVGWPATALALVALIPLLRAALRPDPQGGSLQARLQAGFAGSVLVVALASMYELPLRAGAVSLLAAVAAGAVLGLSEGRRPGGRAPAALAALGLAVVLLAAAAWGHGRLRPGGAFADPDAAIARGRAALEAAGVDRAAWSIGGDPAALQAARGAFEDALWARPVDRVALQELARVRYRLGDAEGAARALRVATAIYPSLPWAWRDLARLYRAGGDHLAAWQAWSQALALDLPADAPVEGWLREALQGPGGAEVAALAALPPRADRWLAAAALLEAEGAPEAALALLHEAVALDPGAAAQLAFAHLRWGQPTQALAALPQAPTTCAEQLARAEALRQLSRCDEAVALAEQAMATCGSEDRQVRLLLARSRLCLGDERALGVLEALVREEPDEHGPRRTLAHELARRGRTSDALRHLEVLDKAGALKAEDRALLDRLRGAEAP